MRIAQNELISVLGQFNPWWAGGGSSGLSRWKRAAFSEVYTWTVDPPAPRAVLLAGARQVGKTTLLLQVIERLLENAVPAANILYATFDHPLLKLAGIEAVLEAWREREPRVDGPEYIFFDEVQFIKDWGTWIKLQVDFHKERRILFTGSATPLVVQDQESGVGRWHAIKLTTLSFYEYLQLKGVELPELQPISSLLELFAWDDSQFYRISQQSEPYRGHFHEYLLRGGFPQTAQMESMAQAQRLLREDIIDKVLKRDMTALFGVRNVLDLENTFLYLCMHDGGLLDMPGLCKNLGVSRPTAQKYIDLLEATHLIYRLPPYGHGKEILRGKYKIYLADAAMAPAVLLKTKALLEDPVALGTATETAVFKHLFTRYYSQNVRFSHWRGKKGREVDLVAEMGSEMIPFEVKYRAQHAEVRDLAGLVECMKSHSLSRGYVVTKSLQDFGMLEQHGLEGAHIMRIPAPLLCYWMGMCELRCNAPG